MRVLLLRTLILTHPQQLWDKLAVSLRNMCNNGKDLFSVHVSKASDLWCNNIQLVKLVKLGHLTICALMVYNFECALHMNPSINNRISPNPIKPLLNFSSTQLPELIAFWYPTDPPNLPKQPPTTSIKLPSPLRCSTKQEPFNCFLLLWHDILSHNTIFLSCSIRLLVHRTKNIPQDNRWLLSLRRCLQLRPAQGRIWQHSSREELVPFKLVPTASQQTTSNNQHRGKLQLN